MNQLGISRIENAQLQSRITMNSERFNRIKLKFIHEKISKQKNILKYIRELMKKSDLQITLDAICKK